MWQETSRGGDGRRGKPCRISVCWKQVEAPRNACVTVAVDEPEKIGAGDISAASGSVSGNRALPRVPLTRVGFGCGRPRRHGRNHLPDLVRGRLLVLEVPARQAGGIAV